MAHTVIDANDVEASHVVFCSPDARRPMRAAGDGLVWIGIGAAGGARASGNP